MRIVVLALAALLATSASARADVPQARLAIGTGLRLNFGELGNDFAWGWQIVDVQAALQPIQVWRSRLRTGPAWWSTLSRYTATNSAAVDQRFSFLQMGVGWRVQMALPLYEYPISVHAQIGYEMLRASHPVPPDDKDVYFGPTLQAGMEFGTGSSFWGVQATWDLVGLGPQGVYVIAYVGLGSL
jgi:hypothetical protein